MKPLFPLFFACTLAASFAWAGEQKSAAPAPTPTPPLSTTGEWLSLQASGTARGLPNPLPGEALEQIYQRYLDSFTPAAPASGNPQAR